MNPHYASTANEFQILTKSTLGISKVQVNIVE